MHIITNPDGIPACYHCARPFDEHPWKRRRQELHAKLCAIEDNDGAARAFHFHRGMQAHADKMQELWVNSHGLHIADVGSIHSEGIRFTLEPSVPPERMIAEVDQHLLPAIREHIIEVLNGTYDTKVQQWATQMPAKPHDPTWCPDTPTVQELYPHGYVRHADGNVEEANDRP